MSLESKYNNSFSKAACVTDAGLVGEYLHIKQRETKTEMSHKQYTQAISRQSSSFTDAGLVGLRRRNKR
jgi:hypothetical protein